MTVGRLDPLVKWKRPIPFVPVWGITRSRYFYDYVSRGRPLGDDFSWGTQIIPTFPKITRSRYFTSPEGFSSSGDVWYASGEVVLTREAYGGFDFFREKNQTEPTSPEEPQNHTILTSPKEQNQTKQHLPSSKTIPSWHLLSMKTIPSSHLPSIEPYHL